MEPRFMAVHDSTRYYSVDGERYSDCTGDSYSFYSVKQWSGVEFWYWCDRREDWLA